MPKQLIKPFYQHFASTLQARHNCHKNDNNKWFWRHDDRIDLLVDTLPTGGWISDIHFRPDLSDMEEFNKLTFAVYIMMYDTFGSHGGYAKLHATVTSSLQFGYDLNVEVADDDTEGFLYEEQEEPASLIDDAVMDALHEQLHYAFGENVILTCEDGKDVYRFMDRAGRIEYLKARLNNLKGVASD